MADELIKPKTPFLSSGRGSLAMLSMIEGLAGISSSYQIGKAEKALAKSNRFISSLKEKNALARGQEAESKARGGTKKAVASQKATMASQGINLSTGSAVDVVRETEDVGELDALTLRNNAMREAFGHKVEGIGSELQSDVSGINRKAKGFSTFLSSGISGLGQYDKWRQGK